MEPTFNALTAPELRKIVLDSIDRAFDQSGEFGQNITFPKVNWNFRLEVKVYPAAFPDKLVKTEGEVKRSEPEDPAAYRILTFGQTAGVDTPDLARQQNNLPLPTPKVGPDGIIADAAVMSPHEPDPIPVTLEIKEGPGSVDPQAEIAVTGNIAAPAIPDIPADIPALLTEEQKAAIYANVRIPDEKAKSVTIATVANPGGVKVDLKGGTPVKRNK